MVGRPGAEPRVPGAEPPGSLLPRCARSSSAAACAASAGSPPRSAWAFTIERDAATRPGGRMGLEGRAQVRRAPALRAHARKQEDRPRHQLAHARQALGAGGAHHRADQRQAALAPRARRRRRRPARRAARAAARRRRPGPGGPRAPGFEVFTSRKQPAPAAAAASTSGSTESRPSSGLAVNASAPKPGTSPNGPGRGAHERLGVGRGRDRHVAPLAVGQHEQAVLARGVTRVGERVPPRRAQPLEARELQLHRHARLPRRLDGGAAVTRHGGRGELRRGALRLAAGRRATAQQGPGRDPGRLGCDAPLRAPRAGRQTVPPG